MCDPLVATAIGAVASAGASIYEGQQASSQLQATQNAQTQANAQWVAYQTKIHQQQVAAEDAARQKATGVQQSTLQKVSPEAQSATQAAEQERLNTAYNKPGATAQDPNNPQDMLLSGEQGGNQQSINSITSQINQATAQARSRIAALATANSYGGSFGGLGTTVPIEFAKGGNDINLQNSIRQGNLKTYGVQQQVQPINYAVGPGTEQTMSLAKGLGSLAGSLAGYAGPQLLGKAGGLSGLFGGSTGNVGDFSTGDYSGLQVGTPDFSYLNDSMFA